MKKYAAFSAILLYVFTLPLSLKASNLLSQQEQFNPTAVISFVPQYFAVNGLRLDYDLSFNPNHWLQMAPVFFYRNSPSDGGLSYDRFNSQKGAGLHIYHRYYPGEGFGKSTIYLGYGPVYHYNHLHYDQTTDNISYERYNSIHKTGLDGIIGFYTLLSDNMMVDFYFGMGFRYSFLSSDANSPLKFNTTYSDFGYSGNIFVFGFRIGFITGNSR